MTNQDDDSEAPQVYLLGKTYLANNQAQFYIRNDPIVQMAAGDRHTIIVTQTGRAFTFGDNSSGQLGLGHKNNVEKVSCIKSLKFGDTGERVILAACGRESSLVATNRGSIYAFGSNSRSQLAMDSKGDVCVPTKVEELAANAKWKQLAMGAEHACALTEEGQVYVWGSNEDGQCGLAKKYDTVARPKELRTDAPIIAVSCGYYHTALISKDGRLYVFGNNEDGRLGHSKTDPSIVGPVEVPMTDRVKAVACGHQHTVVLTETGKVFACGHGDRGQIGLGPKLTTAKTFELVHGLPKNVSAIAAGEGHTAVLAARGDIFFFGDGKHGKLGSTTHSNEFEPCIADKYTIYHASKIACGGCQTVFLAQKRSAESEEDIGNTTLSITQRPKSRARVERNRSITERSQNVSDSMDSTMRHAHVREDPSHHLRVEPNLDSDADRSDKELSESLKSATFNQTHTLNMGKFRPTQNPSLNRTSLRENEDELRPIKTGVLDRTVRLSKDADDSSARPSNRLPSLNKSPGQDRSIKEKFKSEEDDQNEQTLTRSPSKLAPAVRDEHQTSPKLQHRDDSESDDHSPKRPVDKSMSEKPTRKAPAKVIRRQPPSSSSDDDDEESQPTLSNRQSASKAPPIAARRGSLPTESVSSAPARNGNQTIGSRPTDGVRGSFRAPATKTLAKPTPTPPPAVEPAKTETPPAPPVGIFARIFGPKQPPPPAPEKPAPAPAAATTNSRACSIM